MNTTFTFRSIILLLLSFHFLACNEDSVKDAAQPNIILIMGDDIGFSDLSCYGGEIPTPNIDRLADEGLRFRQFYNMSKCETTRSSMLTGLYQGDSRALSFIGLHKENGYHTYQFGKEHFSEWVPDRCTAKNTCDESVTFWATTEFFIPPDSNFSRPFFRNGVETNAWDLEYDIDPFYKTDVFTDYGLRYLDQTLESEKPFFLYLPYHSAHYPLQARPEDIKKFQGKYLKGWDELREERYRRMIELGVLDPKYKLSEPTSNINKYRGHPGGNEDIRANIPLYRPWDDLSDQEKEDLDLEMAVFAAMVHRMDYNIGRVMQWLDDNNKREQTLVIYLTDNGSCPYDSNKDFIHPPGGAESYRTLCAAWANLGNTPFRYFKQFGHEGGAHTHCIVSWPKVIREKGGFTDQPAHVVDFFPTFLEAAGIEYPTEINSLPTIPLSGTSLMPILNGEKRTAPEYIVSGFKERFRMFRQGDWKIVRANEGEWELYNLNTDLTETMNLASTNPDKVLELQTAYQEWKATLPVEE